MCIVMGQGNNVAASRVTSTVGHRELRLEGSNRPIADGRICTAVYHFPRVFAGRTNEVVLVV